MFERSFLGGFHGHFGHFMHGGRGGGRREGKRGRGADVVAGDRGHHGGRERFGRGGFGRGGGGGGRVFGPGDLRLVLLAFIEEKPRHGYELIKELEAKFGGGYTPSPGRAYLREEQAALNSALARMDMAARAVSGEAPPPDLHHAMHTPKAALMFHR